MPRGSRGRSEEDLSEESRSEDREDDSEDSQATQLPQAEEVSARPNDGQDAAAPEPLPKETPEAAARALQDKTKKEKKRNRHSDRGSGRDRRRASPERSRRDRRERDRRRRSHSRRSRDKRPTTGSQAELHLGRGEPTPALRRMRPLEPEPEDHDRDYKPDKSPKGKLQKKEPGNHGKARSQSNSNLVLRPAPGAKEDPYPEAREGQYLECEICGKRFGYKSGQFGVSQHIWSSHPETSAASKRRAYFYNKGARSTSRGSKSDRDEGPPAPAVPPPPRQTPPPHPPSMDRVDEAGGERSSGSGAARSSTEQLSQRHELLQNLLNTASQILRGD